MKGSTDFAARWLQKAKNDLIAAEKILEMAEGPTDIVCFHAQQTVEKALKSLLTFHKLSFPKIHHLVRLLDLALPYCSEL